MIVNALIHNKWHYAENESEICELITEVIENSEPEGIVTVDSMQFPTAGEDARFMISDRRHTSGDEYPYNELAVAVNPSTGYGALIWHVSKKFARKGGIYDHIWVSNNPKPPNLDPRVVSDPWNPTFHDPRSALPVPQVRAALEEFCRTGTGDRPQSIGWVRGWMDGHRIDESP
ncbi:Imm1 family immunity protein [Krasilnikovia sp. M28-CT-15]|uniref:Imm1 family immunity protein n=1 Tax=Krasilnikovia sp. M28-CT-15 TaxID=3373540 RepID=UPI003875FB82